MYHLIIRNLSDNNPVRSETYVSHVGSEIKHYITAATCNVFFSAKQQICDPAGEATIAAPYALSCCCHQIMSCGATCQPARDFNSMHL